MGATEKRAYHTDCPAGRQSLPPGLPTGTFPATLTGMDPAGQDKSELTLSIAPGVTVRLVRVAALDGWVQPMPVTEGQFHGFDAHIPNTGRPLTGAPWDRARAFCSWMNAQFDAEAVAPGHVFRLLRQWEWTSCARGERSDGPAWGDRCPGLGCLEVVENLPLEHRVDDSPNAWNLCALENGLWEWTEDIFDPDMNRRIIRGACWFGTHEGERQFLFFRTPAPHRSHPGFGFRLMIGRPIPGSHPTPSGEH